MDDDKPRNREYCVCAHVFKNTLVQLYLFDGWLSICTVCVIWGTVRVCVIKAGWNVCVYILCLLHREVWRLLRMCVDVHIFVTYTLWSISSKHTVFSFTRWWLIVIMNEWLSYWQSNWLTDWDDVNIVCLFWLRILLRFETCLDISGMCQTAANSLWAHTCISTTNTHAHALLQTHTHTVSIHP